MALRKEVENPMVTLDRMFEEYELGEEFKSAWDAFKAEHNRVCADNFNFRKGGKNNAPAA